MCVRVRECVDLQHAAFADSKGVSQQVEVGASDLHIFNTAHVRPGHHLSPGRQSDRNTVRRADRRIQSDPVTSLIHPLRQTHLIGREAGSPPM